MDVAYINPFLESIDSVFQMMLSTQPKRAALKIGKGGGETNEVTSLVGISGEVSGVVVLRFPFPTALELASRMLGSPLKEMNSAVIDAVSELVNMVAGSAKAKFQCDPPLELGLPTVVEGSGYRLKYPTKSAWLEIPFDSDAGKFSMELTFGSK